MQNLNLYQVEKNAHHGPQKLQLLGCLAVQVLDGAFDPTGARWMVMYNIGAESGGNPVVGSNLWAPANPGVITPTGSTFSTASRRTGWRKHYRGGQPARHRFSLCLCVAAAACVSGPDGRGLSLPKWPTASIYL